MGSAMIAEERIYQRIGEFAVSFQWLEGKLREIGWFILDPEREEWPPKSLRNLTNNQLIDKVHKLFLTALPQCDLPSDLEQELRQSFDAYAQELHQIRKDRNRILHSAFIELKAGGEVQGLVRSDPRLGFDEETGESLFDQEYLAEDSFDKEMKRMAEAGMFLGRAYIQLRVIVESGVRRDLKEAAYPAGMEVHTTNQPRRIRHHGSRYP